MEKRRMCPNCRAFITIGDRVCPYCGVQLGPRAVDMRPSAFAASFLPQANLTSIIIFVINAAFFVVELAVNYRFYKNFDISGGVAVLLGAEVPRFVQAGQWWRLITAGFLHGGFLHIALNSWSLFILVTEVEQFYGTSRLIAAYVFSTFTGFLCAYYFSSAGSVLGASAPAFGLIGIMMAMGLRGRSNPLTQAVRTHYGQWLIFGLVMSLGGGISMAGHVGGFIGGFVVGFLAGLPGLPGTPRELLWKSLAILAIVITLYAWLQDLLFYSASIKYLANT
ncbi:MAG TPA: rhomboid family intramembrane serine protease [Bryobacteraceae bacterium]